MVGSLGPSFGYWVPSTCIGRFKYAFGLAIESFDEYKNFAWWQYNFSRALAVRVSFSVSGKLPPGLCYSVPSMRGV